MSIFDKDAFLGTETTEKTSTRRVPVPAGDAPMVIHSLDVKEGTSAKGNDWTMLAVTMIVDSEEAREATGMPEPRVEYSIFLDLTDSGDLDFSEGANVQLGRLREALGQNEEGQSWSPNMLIGGAVLGTIEHDPDKEDPETVYARVKAVTSLS